VYSQLLVSVNAIVRLSFVRVVNCKIHNTLSPSYQNHGLWTDLSTITVPVAVGSVEWWIYNTKISSLARTQLSENTRVYLIDLNGGIDFVREPEA